MATNRLKIEVREDRYGNLELDPINQRELNRCKRRIIEHHKQGCPGMHSEYQKEETEKWLCGQSCVFVNADSTAYYEFLENLRLTKSEIRDIQSGWSVTKLVDVDTWEHLFTFANKMPDEY